MPLPGLVPYLFHLKEMVASIPFVKEMSTSAVNFWLFAQLYYMHHIGTYTLELGPCMHRVVALDHLLSMCHLFHIALLHWHLRKSPETDTR